MAELYAICRDAAGLEVRHVQLNQQVQLQLDALFRSQEDDFLEGVVDDVDFTGDWKPDPNEILVIRNLPEVQILWQAANQNAVALPPLDIVHFQDQNIHGLFTVVGRAQNRRLLVQNFGAQQFLSSRMAFLFDNNVFRRLTEPAFSFGTGLVAIIGVAGEIRFKSYALLRRVLDVTPIFRQATDQELGNFAALPSLEVADVNAFVAAADEGVRKLVMAITKADVLNAYTVRQIATRAAAIGFVLNVSRGCIVVPNDRKGAKQLFSFLLDKVYLGPLNQQLFITNSNRPL